MCLVTWEEQKSYTSKIQINSHMFRGKTLKIYDRNMSLLLSILTQWHYSVFKTKIYLPRKYLSNSQEDHTVITWRVQSRRVKTSIRPSLGTFHCQLSHCKVSIVHQTSVPYSFLLWPHQHWEQNCLLCIEQWTLMYFHTSRLFVAPRSCQDSFLDTLFLEQLAEKHLISQLSCTAHAPVSRKKCTSKKDSPFFLVKIKLVHHTMRLIS